MTLRHLIALVLLAPTVVGCLEPDMVTIPATDRSRPTVRMTAIPSRGRPRMAKDIAFSVPVGEKDFVLVIASAKDPEGVRKLELSSDAISWICGDGSAYPPSGTVEPPESVVVNGPEVVGELGPTTRALYVELESLELFGELRQSSCADSDTISVSYRFFATAENYSGVIDEGPIVTVVFSGPVSP